MSDLWDAANQMSDALTRLHPTIGVDGPGKPAAALVKYDTRIYFTLVGNECIGLSLMQRSAGLRQDKSVMLRRWDKGPEQVLADLSAWIEGVTSETA